MTIIWSRVQLERTNMKIKPDSSKFPTLDRLISTETGYSIFRKHVPGQTGQSPRETITVQRRYWEILGRDVPGDLFHALDIQIRARTSSSP